MPPPVSSIGGCEPVASRKVRKGTRSCWECKRRKVRCVFRSMADTKCVPCTRRRASCQSQEHEEFSVNSLTLEERVVRLESLVETLNEKRGSKDHQIDLSTGRTENLDGLSSPLSGTTAFSEPVCLSGHTQSQVTSEDSNPIETESSARHSLSVFADLTQVSAILHAELPSKREMDALMSNKRAVPFLSFWRHSELMYNDNDEPILNFLIPSLTDHPVLLARALLQLAFCLEHAAAHKITIELTIAKPWKDIALHWYETASRFVTSNDVLIDSVEGLECLFVEGMYLLNTGNLRRAWLIFRRAMSLAQMIGVDRTRSSSNIKVLDRRTHFSCPIILSRLIYVERYLSLLIGMPSTTTGSFLNAEDMNEGPPRARIEKAHALICGKIIQRNRMMMGHEAIHLDSVSITREIDSDLERVASSVPSSWWKIPVLRQEMGVGEWLGTILHAHCQIIHNSLILITHLPNLLGDGNIPGILSSKSACMHASREILHRYSTLRSHLKAVFCCRFVDYCAFKAALALLLIHIDSIRKENLKGIQGHQRISDRALVSAVLEVMDDLYHIGQDLLCRDAVAVTRRLLQFEDQASQEGETISVQDMDENENGKFTNSNGGSFELQIPYFGTVRITKERLRGYPNQGVAMDPATHTSERLTQGSPLEATLDGSMLSPELASVTNLPAVPEGVGLYQNQDANEWASQEREDQNGFMTPLIDFQNIPSEEIEIDDQPLSFVGADEWSFQGLDSAFFSSVIGSDIQNQ